MKTSIYKTFRDTVENANVYDDVWYAGYLWIDLTPRQQADIDMVLKTKGFLSQVVNSHGTWHKFPNGLLFKSCAE